ncbi:MAG: hypothetical protein ACREFO_10835 [Acetobacteraceae bacterium]
MTEVPDDVREHHRATGLTERPKTALMTLGPDFAQLSANLGRNLLEGRLSILTAVFEAESTST